MNRGIPAINMGRIVMLMTRELIMRINKKIPVMRFIALLQTLHRINNVIPLVFRQTGLFESHVNNLRALEKQIPFFFKEPKIYRDQSAIPLEFHVNSFINCSEVAAKSVTATPISLTASCQLLAVELPSLS